MKPQLLQGLITAFSIDYRTLALFRILIGLLIIADLVMRSMDFTGFFPPDGALSRELAVNVRSESVWSLFFLFDNPVWAYLLFALTMLSALLLVLGYRTRVMALVSLILLFSVQMSNPIIMQGGDSLMRVLLFWGLFLPLGARYSIDAALAKDAETAYPNQSHFSAATVALLMQVMYVYWAGALLKTGAPWVEHYNAVFVALNAEQYGTWLGQWVAVHLNGLLPFLTQFVYLIELYGPLFLVSPVLLLWMRMPILILLICMHIGFVLLLNVGHFPYVSITSLLLFLPPAFWNMLKRSQCFNAHSTITIFYDQDCEFCKKIVALLKVFLLLPQARMLPAQQDANAGPLLEQNDSWVIKHDQDTYYLEWQAMTFLFRVSPLFFWLSGLVGFINKGGVGNKLYHYIGDRRQSLGRITRVVLPWRNIAVKEPRAQQLLVVLLALVVLQMNLSYVHAMPALQSPISTIVKALGLNQKWNMFAPFPINATRWPIIEGITDDGAQVDVFRQRFGAPITAKPDNLLADFSHYRWRKYYSKMYTMRYSGDLRVLYAAYQCKQWNAQYSAESGKQLQTINISVGVERTLNNPADEVQKVIFLSQHDCK